MNGCEGLKLLQKMECAYHEAGHAVVALATGHELAEVVVTSNGGRTLHDPWSALVPSEIANHMKLLVILVAGEVAQELYHLWDPQEAWNESLEYLWDEGSDEYEFVSRKYIRGERTPGGELDVDYAFSPARSICQLRAGTPTTASGSMTEEGQDPEVHAVLCEAERLAARILTANWDAVEKLARSLTRSESGQMSGFEVQEFLGELVAETPPDWIPVA